jgi:hypothetical protein
MATDKYSTVAKSMMESMGWKEGDGLGKERQGRTNALKPRKKIDNAGLGSKRTAGKWLDACCAYDDILQKLNVAYSDKQDEDQDDDQAKLDKKERKRLRKEEKKRKREAEAEEGVDESQDEAPKKKKAKKEKKSKKDKQPKVVEDTEAADDDSDSDSKPTRHIPVARHLIYAKRLKAKQVGEYSDNHKAEIFASIQRQVRSEQLRKDKYSVPARPTPPDSPAAESDSEPEPAPEPKQVARVVEGFTEDTQVDIYNAAMDKQIKGRTGLGVAKKLSKSKRREAACSAHHLTRIGQYLARKFVSAGTLEQVHAKV